MEYPEFGIYEFSLMETEGEIISEKIKGKQHNSAPIKLNETKELKRSKFPNGILKQVYQDLRTVSKFIESTGEQMDRRVFL